MKRSQAVETTPSTDTVTIPHDPINEQIVIAAAMAHDELRDKLVTKLKTDAFLTPLHRQIWGAFTEMARKHLAYDPATVQQILGQGFDGSFLSSLQNARPDVPPNLDHHVELILWDQARFRAVVGPLAQILEGIKDNKTSPDKIRGLARSLAGAFDGYGDRKYLRNGQELVREQVLDIRERMNGRASFQCGIPGLDFFEDSHPKRGESRLVPGFKPGKISVVCGVPGGGKALATNTQIPTPLGWSTMGELKAGDKVFDEKGDPCSVIHCTEVMNDRPCYEVEFSDGAIIRADASHQWLTTTKRERHRRERGKVRTTEEIRDSLLVGAHRNHAIRVARPLNLPDISLPIHPYLLGIWLGDGTSAAGSFTSADLEIVEAIRRIGYNVLKTKALYRWSIRGIVVKLRKLGVLDRKHIPTVYLRSSQEQRMELLRGLMDSDGSATTHGNCNFDTTSPKLASDFEELVASLGIKTKGSERKATLYGRYISQSWRFVFRTDEGVKPFKLTRKAIRLTGKRRGTHCNRYIVAVRQIESVPVKCIQVDSPSHLYLAGKEMIPTHNSTVIARMVRGFASLKKRVLVGAWEMDGGEILELIACQDLNISRHDVSVGNITEETLARLETRMHELGGNEDSYIKFMDIPFNRASGESKKSNDHNLDLIQGYISDVAPEIFVADLWKRALRYTDPNDEEQALIRQQAMCKELNVHGILVQQLRSKDVESRADKRPTRESIKGSGAWIEVPDNIFGIHRPGLWKNIPDDHLDFIILKQRFGPWPMVVQFEFDPARGRIEGGITVPYMHEEAAPKDDFLGGGSEFGKK